MEKLSGIILAGGLSSRMKTDKAMLSLNEKSFLDIQIEKLRAIGIDDIVISRNGLEDTYQDHPIVHDVYHECGPLGGILEGLRAIKNDAAIVLAVDAPLLPLEVLEKLKEVYNGSFTHILSHGRPQPLIAVYPKSLTTIIENMLEQGIYVVFALTDFTKWQAVEIEIDQRLLMNCNTKEEYETAMKVFKELYL